MAVDLGALKTELQSTAYAGFLVAGREDWQELTDALNTPSTGITVQATSATASALRSEVVGSEYDASTNRASIDFYLQGEAGLNIGPGTELRTSLAGLFPSTAQSRANILAMLSRPGSRIEELFAANDRASVNQVQQAWRST